MALDTYANLKTAIGDHLDRDDLTDYLDDFIDLAEARHKREIRIRNMIVRESLTVNARYVNLPSGFIEGLSLRLLTNPVTVLTEVPIYEMSRVRDETTGQPTFFAIHGSEIEFDKAADSSYTGEIIFYKELAALSDANTTNALLTRSPDCYLYAALAAAAPFLMHDDRIATWGTLYINARDELNATDRRSRKTGPLFSRVAGARP